MSQQRILTANVIAVAQRAHDAKLPVGAPSPPVFYLERGARQVTSAW